MSYAHPRLLRERAKSLYQQALPVLEERLGKEYPETVKARNEYQQVDIDSYHA